MEKPQLPTAAEQCVQRMEKGPAALCFHVGWHILKPHPTCIVMVGVVSPPAAVSVVCAADTVMAVGLITWLERVAMVPKVVMGVAREALVLWPPAPARLVETVPVTVPSVVTPTGREAEVE